MEKGNVFQGIFGIGGNGLLRLVLPIILALGWVRATAQSFSSGSDGSDGALNLTDSGSFDFNPAAFHPPLDTDGNNIFNFTTIHIGPKTSIRLSARYFSGPVYWLARGDVLIEGIIYLNADGGHGCQDLAGRRPSLPGAGGFPGGIGGTCDSPAQPGSGPGGGLVSGGSAGHATPGNNGGQAYGNKFMVPLMGGSGGAGATHQNSLSCNFPASGGGAGGGAILIASSTQIQVPGAGMIIASGANGGGGGGVAGCFQVGGSGSGGSIRLVSNSISGLNDQPAWNYAPALIVSGGNGAASGRIRLEAFSFSGSAATKGDWIRSSPMGLFLPTTKPPSIRVVRIAGLDLPSVPDGSFVVPDAIINSGASVPIEIETSQIPVGVTGKLLIFSESAPDQLFDLPATQGTLTKATTALNVVFPPGYSRGYAFANWATP